MGGDVVEMEVGETLVGEDWVKPWDSRSVGLIQFPAPPRPVCKYSGGGWEEERARAKVCVGKGWDSGSVCREELANFVFIREKLNWIEGLEGW